MYIWNAADVGYAGGGTALMTYGGNEKLKPETSTSFTFGIDYKPSFLPSSKFSATYFSIDYKDRVVQPISDTTVALSAEQYSTFVSWAPTEAEQAAVLATADEVDNFSSGSYDPATVVAIIGDDYQNATSQTVRGVDLSYRQGFDLPAGHLDAYANATWTRLRQRTVPEASNLVLSGTIFNVPKLKARGGLTWDYRRFSISGIANYISAETDTGVIPNGVIGSWTTVDLTAAYQIPARGTLASGWKIVVSATNLFDRKPPFAKSPSITYPGLSYDSANASIIGRYTSLSLIKSW